jgi:cytochrome b subunit of formate dehydrogenase
MKALLHKIKKITHWTLLVIIILYVISGLGITYSNIITTITFGFLTKVLSFQIHNFLLIPFIMVLTMHIIFVVRKKN